MSEPVRPSPMIRETKPDDDRVTAGTKAHRDRRPSIRSRVRYGVIMAAILTVAIGAGIAYHNTTKLSSVAGHNTALTRRVAALASENSALVARVASDEQKTCLIQSRGLAANHDLAAALGNLHSLVTLPEPQQPPPAVAVVVAGLNGALSAYLSLEAKQPATRSC